MEPNSTESPERGTEGTVNGATAPHQFYGVQHCSEEGRRGCRGKHEVFGFAGVRLRAGEQELRL